MTTKDLQQKYNETDFGNHESTAALFQAIIDYLDEREASKPAKSGWGGGK